MKKNPLSLAEIAQRILIEKKLRRLFEGNAAGLASSVQSQVMALGKEIQAAGDDITDEEVQGAMLMAALDNKGKVDKVEPEDVDSMVQNIKEARGYVINESALHTLEVVGSILGNAAFLNVISKALEKIAGKKMDPGKIQAGIQKILKVLKTVTGLPAKAMEKFFAWVTKLLGGGPAAQKIAGVTGTMLVVAFMFALGTAFFPVLGGSPLMIILSLTGLIGKGFEMKHLLHAWDEAVAEYKKEGGKGADTLSAFNTATN